MKEKWMFARTLVLALVLVLSIVGCGEDPTPIPTDTPLPTKTPLPTRTPLPTEPPQPTATALPEPTAAPAVVLGEEYRSEIGGFAFRMIPGYTLEDNMGFVSVEAPDADPDIGPALLMIGAQSEESLSLEQLFERFMSDVDVPVSNQREVTVGDIPGLMVDVSISEGGLEAAGQIVVVTVTPVHHFTLLGVAPGNRWDGEFAPLFEAVLNSIQFFEPVAAVEPEAPAPTSEPKLVEAEIRQWAVSAEASSQYGEEGDPDWSPEQATGAPDTRQCGDWETAWASASRDGVEWLELRYEIPVRPNAVNVIQSYNPNQIVQVELLDTEGTYHTVYSGEAQDLAECPYTLSVAVEGANYEADAVRITIDQALIGIWNEIDAVELVGWGEVAETAEVPAAPTAAAPPAAYSGEVQVLAPSGWELHTNANFVEDVALDGDGNLWAVGPGGVVRWALDGTYTKYTANDGLARNVVNAVAVAPDGSLWFGTDSGGVSHLEGAAAGGAVTWTTYTYNDGLASNSVNAIAVAPDGTLWFGHSASGVTHFDGQAWTTYDKESGLVSDSVYDIAVAPDGVVWVGTWSGVSRFDPSAAGGEAWTSYTEEDGLADDTTYAVAIDADGAVWFGTYNGVSRFDPSAAKAGGEAWISYTRDDGLAGSIVDAIAVAPDGALWFSAGGSFDSRGASRFDPSAALSGSGEAWTYYTEDDGLADNNVNGIAITPDGTVWLGHNSGGVSCLKGNAWAIYATDDQLLINELWAVAVAPDGSLWIGSDELGAAHFDGQAWTTYTHDDDGLVSDVVLTIVPAPDGSLWFGTAYGVSHFDPAAALSGGEAWTHYSEETGMPEERVDYMALAADGSVWVGSWTSDLGVARLDPLAAPGAGSEAWTVYGTGDGLARNSINGIAATPDGSVWFATGSGVSRYDGQTWTTYTADSGGLASDVAKSITVAPDGAVWVGTWRGVSRWDAASSGETGTWTNYGSSGIIFSSLAVASDGTVWAGNETLSEGLYHFDGQEWTTYTTQDGLVDQSILEITAGPGGTVWVATRAGLSSYGP